MEVRDYKYGLFGLIADATCTVNVHAPSRLKMILFTTRFVLMQNQVGASSESRNSNSGSTSFVQRHQHRNHCAFHSTTMFKIDRNGDLIDIGFEVEGGRVNMYSRSVITSHCLWLRHGTELMTSRWPGIMSVLAVMCGFGKFVSSMIPNRCIPLRCIGCVVVAEKGDKNATGHALAVWTELKDQSILADFQDARFGDLSLGIVSSNGC